ncbi:MAG TPA: S1C family serine protease [Anaeromyxobacteraceae bacterium]|nr:S1C family serine protease [Anaeromyxobacteraceae bacterium]
MAASPPALDMCPACGQHSDAEVSCTRCGANLRVDLWVEGPVPDERKRFAAARGLASLGLPGGTVSRLKRDLARRADPVVFGLTRSMARAAIEVLGREGISAVARGSLPRRTTSPVRPVLGGIAAGLVLAGGLLHLGRQRRAAIDGEAGTARAVPARALAPTAATPAARSPVPLTTQEIANLAVGSVVEVTCGGKLGTAFFVDPEHAATNEHVLCGMDAPLRLRLKDGRELLGRAVAVEKALDVAVIEVPGAAAKAIELGDSTVLLPGDPLVFIGNPHGLDFTVHDGKVSYVGRNLFGKAYVQMNATVNPGNSGGPLLDAHGHVVGIVSLKMTSADGIGLALPVEYLRPLLRLPAAALDAQARWRNTLDRVRKENAAEVEQYRDRYQRPAIIEVGLGSRGGLYAVVLQRWRNGPSRLSITVDVRANDQTLCSANATIADWEQVEQILEKELRDAPDQPRLVWASENHILRDVFAGTAPLDLGRCALDRVPPSAVMVIHGGDQVDSPVRFPKPSIAAAGARIAAEQERARKIAREERAAREEARWRHAFEKLRAAVAGLEERRDKLKASADSSLPMDDSSRPRRELSEMEARLAKAKEALDDLERQASAAAVPREWRQ